MAELTVQVPATLIEVLHDLVERDNDYDPANPNARRSWEHGIDCGSIEWGYDGIEGDSGDPCDCWLSVVADLLSQPTPSVVSVDEVEAWRSKWWESISPEASRELAKLIGTAPPELTTEECMVVLDELARKQRDKATEPRQ